MKYHLFITLLLGILIPSMVNGQWSTPSTYAVVVGISDYQDEDIPDLRFADKDAEAFAGFLQSPAGGSLDEDHLKVLINEQATMAQFAIALDWLWEVVEENDRVIIYFSGHGDVERKSLTQPGFLLCWDAPAKVYLAGGTLALPMFQEVISTLSIQNKAKVIVITDACRSGKLSGSSVGGAQLTSSNLAKQYGNEIKILSCQPDEYSIEGEQWGGGRGAFSYHLLDGLHGMADGNEDLNVNLKEIGRYLEDRVTEEVAPQKQNPMIIGNKTEKLTDVFPEILAQLQQGRRGELLLFSSTDQRGIEDDVLAKADSNVVEMYVAFKESIANKKFLLPENASADFYYEQLRREPQLERLHSSMRRNYAAALQDDAQQVMNKILKSDPGENAKTVATINQDYAQFPKNLRRAAELLGEDHYMHSILMARSYWFEGYIKDESKCSCKNIANANKVLPYYQKALTYQPEMPHAWIQMAAVYGIQKQELDSAEYYANLAVDVVANWTLVYHWMANSYLNYYYKGGGNESLTKAKKWLDLGLAVDSNSIVMINELAYWYNIKGEYHKEQEILDRSFKLKPIAQTLFFKGQGYISWGKYKEAEINFLKAVEMDPSLILDSSGLLKFYYGTKEYGKLVECYTNYFDSGLSGLSEDFFIQYGESLLFTEGQKRAEATLKQLISTYPEEPGFRLSLIAAYTRMGQLNLAMEQFHQAMIINPSIKNCIALSRIFFRTENWELWIQVKEEGFKLEPENDQFSRNMSAPLISLGKYEEAFKAAKKYLESTPNEQANLIAMANIYYERNEFEKAEQYLNRALKGPVRRIARSQILLGMVYQKTGRHQKAEEMFKQAMDSDKGDPPIWWTGLKMRNDRFVKEWEQTLLLLLQWYPHRYEIHFELSKLYANTGEDEKALESLELSLKNGYEDFYDLEWDTNLKPLKENNLEAWQELIQKYAPTSTLKEQNKK